MRKKIKEVVEKILLEDTYARENDNYLFFRVAQILEPELAGNKFIAIINSKLSMESITRKRRDFLNKKHPELKPERMTKIREREEKEYRREYGGKK